MHFMPFLSRFSSVYLSVSASSLTVYLGRQNQDGSNPNEVSRAVTQIISHPNYNPSTFENDIALLKLSSPVPSNSYILPVCLAASDSTFHNGTDSWVTGWGNIQSGGGSQSNLSVTVLITTLSLLFGPASFFNPGEHSNLPLTYGLYQNWSLVDRLL